MAINPSHIGRTYGPFTYKIGVEKLREFAVAVGGGVPIFGAQKAPADLNPLLYDDAAANNGPHGSVVAFPTFCVNFAMAPFGHAVTDPEMGINLLMLVHGEQEFEFFDVMRDGDVMTTTGTVSELYEKASMEFCIVTTESKNQHGKLVVRGKWTAVIRKG